ncbi:MAG: hypothetical protein ACYTGH_04760 [Planctomycetota bacterium]|jgi:hypothetical protein
MYYLNILNSLKQAEEKPYGPQFSLQKEGRNWRIFDGEKEIGKFYHTFIDLWKWSPFADEIKANVDPPNKVIDLHTVHNTFINFGSQGWPKHWLAEKSSKELLQWNWLQESGEKLQAEVSVEGPDQEYGKWLITLSYNQERHQYQLSVSIHVRKLDPDQMEAFNLMTAGALASRPEERRWTHSIWENHRHQARRIVHSNVLFFATDYGNARDGGGPWRFRHLSYPQSWIGYAADQRFNPIILIHDSNIPSAAATCSQLFDEHVYWQKAGQDSIEDDGYFHFKMELEIANISAACAEELLSTATDPVNPKKWWHEDICLPFYFDIENDLETPVDPWAPEECPILVLPKNSEGIRWDDQTAYSGNHSIQFCGNQAHARVELFPCGAVFNVKPHTRYRFTAMVKTEHVDRFARILLQSFEYTYNNIIDSENSKELTGTSDWSEISVELDTKDEVYILPKLQLYGNGTAWFDNLKLTEF